MLDTTPETADGCHRWQGLYRAGSVAAGGIAVLLVGELLVYALYRRPASAAEELALFQDNWIVGLLTLDLLGMLAYLLFIPTILAFYVALDRFFEAVMAVATVLFVVGIADFFATNTAFSVLALSQQYTGAKTEADRAMILAATHAMLTQFNENAFLVSYVLVSTAWLLIAAVMLRSGVFPRAAGYAGIVGGTAGILAVLLEHIPGGPVLLAVAIACYFLAILGLFVWMALATGPLYRLGAHSATTS